MSINNIEYSELIARLFPSEELSTVSITFQVTDACNLACKYCYQINKGNHSMSFDTAKTFIDMLLDNDITTQQYIDFSKKKAVILDFIGGEPLLEIDLIDQICDYFLEQVILRDHPWQYNYRFSFASNGVLYFDPRVQNFLKKHAGHISLSISIDGNKKLHDACRVFPDGSGSYDMAIKAVRHYVDELGGVMGSKMTLSPDNIQFTCEAIISLIQEGYVDILLNCVFEEGWTEEHATILYYQLKELANYLLNNNLQDKIYISMFEEFFFNPKSHDDIQNWCGGNGQMIAIDYKGDIFPCVRYMESSLGNEVPPIVIGNIKDGIMKDAKCKSCVEKLKSVNRQTKSTPECFDCRIANGCAWCQAYNYQASGGDFNKRATFICIMHQARALANSYYWNLKYHHNNEKKRMKIWLEDEKALKIIPKEELALLKLLQYPIR